MIPRAMALVEVLSAAQVEQVELVNQPVFLQEIEGAVDGDAMHARINLLRAFEDRACVQVTFGAIHHLQENKSLTREPKTALFKGFLQAAGAGVNIDSFAGGDAMCGGVHWFVRRYSVRVTFVHKDVKSEGRMRLPCVAPAAGLVPEMERSMRNCG